MSENRVDGNNGFAGCLDGRDVDLTFRTPAVHTAPFLPAGTTGVPAPALRSAHARLRGATHRARGARRGPADPGRHAAGPRLAAGAAAGRRRWALPGGLLGDDEDVEASVRRQLTEKVDVREVAHVEQLAVFSDPRRVPGGRRVATAFLGLVPSDADPAVPADTTWHPVDALPPTPPSTTPRSSPPPGTGCAPSSPTPTSASPSPPASSRSPRCASTTPPRSAIPCRRRTCSGCSTRRSVLVPTGALATPGPAGGRPAALFRFAEPTLRVTDAFAVLRPPGEQTRAALP